MEQSTPQEIFSGFEYANIELGFTQVGNNNFALLAAIDNLSEMKVTLYLMRNTWGYQEYEQGKLITTEEFVNGRKRKDNTRIDSGCGLKTTAVKEGLAKGIEHGRIICDVDDSDKGRIRKYYSLKMDKASKPVIDELDSRVTTMPSHKVTVDSRVTMPDSRKETSNKPQYDHRSEKETLDINPKKQTKEKEESASPLHPIWLLWRSSIDRPTDHVPIERDLNYCLELEKRCKEAKIELTIEMIHQRRDQFRQNNPEKTGWHLGNFVTEMRNHLDQLQPAQPELPEMPELTEEELDEMVLWTEKPSFRDHLISIGDTTVESHFDILSKMSRRDAREYYYDYPESKHYTKEDMVKFERYEASKQSVKLLAMAV